MKIGINSDGDLLLEKLLSKPNAIILIGPISNNDYNQYRHKMRLLLTHIT